MKKFSFIIILFIILSCKSNIKSIYRSNCHILGEPTYTLKVNKNKEFQFTTHLKDTIKGNWTLLKDTLILDSEYFIEASSFDIEKDSILKNIKYTEFNKQEKYLIKRRKLFLITKKGISKECYLK